MSRYDDPYYSEEDAMPEVDDAPALTFGQWIEHLNAEAETRPYADKPLTGATGTECWRGYFDQGFTPAEALAEDERA